MFSASECAVSQGFRHSTISWFLHREENALREIRDSSAERCQRHFPQTSHLQQLVITHEHGVESYGGSGNVASKARRKDECAADGMTAAASSDWLHSYPLLISG